MKQIAAVFAGAAALVAAGAGAKVVKHGGRASSSTSQRRHTRRTWPRAVAGARGDPAIVVGGLPDTAVKESRDRVTTAIANSGYYWPRGRTTINLAPADVKKEGPSFDLPIALAMIARLKGNGRKKPILIMGHSDTVTTTAVMRASTAAEPAATLRRDSVGIKQD